MTPYPTPGLPIPVLVKVNEQTIQAEKETNDVIKDIYGSTEGDLISAYRLSGDVVKELQSSLAKKVNSAYRTLNNIDKVLAPSLDAIPSPNPIPPGVPAPGEPIPFPPIPSPTPIPPVSPLPPECPPGGGGPPIVIEPPIIKDPPVDLPPPATCPPCPSPGEPAPCPEPPPCPPPPDPPCLPPQPIQILCWTPPVYATFCGIEPEKCKTICDGPPAPAPIDPFPIKPLGGPDGGMCKDLCVTITGKETVQITSQAPFPLARDGNECAYSECGIAQFTNDCASELPVSKVLGQGGTAGLSASIAAQAVGSVDFTSIQMSIDILIQAGKEYYTLIQ